MPPSEARLYFVVTVKGDLGPFSKQELREQLREQTFAGADRVRNAWGRPLGSVSEILGNASQVHQAHQVHPAPQPVASGSSQRRPSKSSPPWPIIAVTGGMLAIGLLLWLTSGGSPPPPPAPAAPPEAPRQEPSPPKASQPTTPPVANQQAAPSVRPAAANGLPAGFAYLDLGDARPKGNANANDRGVIVISGGGGDIWGGRDECAFMHRKLAGDAVITVELRQMDNTDSWNKAGLMVRASTASDAVHCSLVAIHTGQIQFITRHGQGHDSTCSELKLPSFPMWLRLERRGSVMNGSASADGRAWQSVGSVDLANMAGATVAGLAVCSHNRSITNRTVFADLTISEGR